jgi:hypothetical protein
MSTPSALAGAFTTAALIAALGSPAAVEAAREAESRAVGRTLTGFADWDVGDLPGEAVRVVVLRLALTLLVVALLCGLAGRSRSRGAAFLAGWGAVVVATAVGGAAAYAYEATVVLDGRTYGPTFADRIAVSTNAAAAFGLWTGWIVGAVVAVATRPAPTAAGATAAVGAGARGAATAPARRIAEPPPPWWAPTRSGHGDGAVRPGPTVFLPGGAHAAAAAPHEPVAPRTATPPPVVPEATYEMTTVSGDPHPSDPDATHPVGMPPSGDARVGDGGGDGPRGGSGAGDADAATTRATEDPDRTRQHRPADG